MGLAPPSCVWLMSSLGFSKKVFNLPGLNLFLSGIPESVSVSIRSLNLEDFLEHIVFFLLGDEEFLVVEDGVGLF